MLFFAHGAMAHGTTATYCPQTRGILDGRGCKNRSLSIVRHACDDCMASWHKDETCVKVLAVPKTMLASSTPTSPMRITPVEWNDRWARKNVSGEICANDSFEKWPDLVRVSSFKMFTNHNQSLQISSSWGYHFRKTPSKKNCPSHHPQICFVMFFKKFRTCFWYKKTKLLALPPPHVIRLIAKYRPIKHTPSPRIFKKIRHYQIASYKTRHLQVFWLETKQGLDGGALSILFVILSFGLVFITKFNKVSRWWIFFVGWNYFHGLKTRFWEVSPSFNKFGFIVCCDGFVEKLNALSKKPHYKTDQANNWSQGKKTRGVSRGGE